MKYVITGATSFIGIELSRCLMENGHEVYAVCRKSSSKAGSLPVGINVVYAEMADYGNLHTLIDSADVFVNLAWEGTGHGGRDDTEIQKENIQNTICAIQSAHRMGCKLFVEAGSQAEYGTVPHEITEETPCNPFSEYGKAKLSVKEKAFALCEELKMKYIHLRIFSVYGEDDHPWTLVMSCVDKMLRNEDVDLSSCSQYWNFIYVKDAAKQIAGLCEHAITLPDFRHEVYNIASDDTRVLKEFIEEMSRQTGTSSRLNYGVIVPANVVTLQPNISKLTTATHITTFTPFEKVVRLIINKLQKS